VIFFATVHLNKTVHVQALGFTQLTYYHVWGRDQADAAANLFQHLLKHDIRIVKSTIKKAQVQNPAKYTADIIGLTKQKG
jgi:hypothetical protein